MYVLVKAENPVERKSLTLLGGLSWMKQLLVCSTKLKIWRKTKTTKAILLDVESEVLG
jgi:hypothetical protein